MDKSQSPHEEPKLPPVVSLAEEQRQAFDEDRKRGHRPTLSLRWPGFLPRN